MRTVTPIPAVFAAMLALVCLLGIQGYRTQQRVRLAERRATKAEQVAELAHERMDVRLDSMTALLGLSKAHRDRARQHLQATHNEDIPD